MVKKNVTVYGNYLDREYEIGQVVKQSFREAEEKYGIYIK